MALFMENTTGAIIYSTVMDIIVHIFQYTQLPTSHIDRKWTNGTIGMWLLNLRSYSK